MFSSVTVYNTNSKLEQVVRQAGEFRYDPTYGLPDLPALSERARGLGSRAEESDLNADLWPRHKRREARGCPKSDDVRLLAGF